MKPHLKLVTILFSLLAVSLQAQNQVELKFWTVETRKLGEDFAWISNGGKYGSLVGVFTDAQFQNLEKVFGERQAKLSGVKSVRVKDNTPSDMGKLPKTFKSLKITPRIDTDDTKIDLNFQEIKKGIIGEEKVCKVFQITIWDGQILACNPMNGSKPHDCAYFVSARIVDEKGVPVRKKPFKPTDVATTKP